MIRVTSLVLFTAAVAVLVAGSARAQLPVAPAPREVRPDGSRPPAPAPPDQQRQRRLRRLRDNLEKERAALARWMARLKRAFHATEKSQRRVARIERLLSKLEED